MSRHGGRHVQTSLAFPFPPRVASRAYARGGGGVGRGKDYVSQIGITRCERRHRARCARGISREVSPSASSIPDAIVRVKV